MVNNEHSYQTDIGQLTVATDAVADADTDAAYRNFMHRQAATNSDNNKISSNNNNNNNNERNQYQQQQK